MRIAPLKVMAGATFLPCALLAISTIEGEAASIDVPAATYSGNYAFDAEGSNTDRDSAQYSSSGKVTGPGSIPVNLSAPLIGPTEGCCAVYVNFPVGSTETGNVTVNTASAPSISAISTAYTVPYNGALAGATGNAGLQYSFQIIGPSSSVPVLVQASGGVSVSGAAPGAAGNQIADASFSVGLNSGGSFINDSVGINAYGGLTAYTGPTSESFNENQVYSLQTGTLYTVTLALDFGGSVSGNLGGGEETLSAFVDPLFTIAAADPNDYSLVFSDGINNVAAAPLPSTWAMMSSAFMLFGSILLFRRKRHGSGLMASRL